MAVRGPNGKFSLWISLGHAFATRTARKAFERKAPPSIKAYGDGVVAVLDAAGGRGITLGLPGPEGKLHEATLEDVRALAHRLGKISFGQGDFLYSYLEVQYPSEGTGYYEHATLGKQKFDLREHAPQEGG